MNDFPHDRILSNLSREEFVGRSAVLDRLIRTVREQTGCMVLAAPRAGLTELLRQAYDRLFTDQAEIIPFYFEFRCSDRDLQDALLRFDHECLAQLNAFRRRDPRLAFRASTVSEAAGLAVPEDIDWLDEWIDNSFTGHQEPPGRAARTLPVAASLAGNRVAVFFDNAEILDGPSFGQDSLSRIGEALGRARVPVVFGGRRRALYARTDLSAIRLENHEFEAAGELIEATAARSKVTVSEQARDLIAVQLAGNAGAMTDLILTAVDLGTPLETFEQVETCYTEALLGGRIGRRIDSAIADSLEPGADPQAMLKLLTETISGGGALPASYWRRNSGLTPIELDKTLRSLHSSEVINRSAGRISVDRFDRVLRDHLLVRKGLEIDRLPRARVVAGALTENIREAPTAMARLYRLRAALNLRSLMEAFDGREVPDGLIDYGVFRERFKGLNEKDLNDALLASDRKLTLPRFAYTTHTANLYPDIEKLVEIERSSVAMGSVDGAEIAWMAMQIDSKLEATAETASFWFDRMEAAALSAGLENYRVWLIAPEGFTADALEVINGRGGIGSSHQQLRLLEGMLGTASSVSKSDEGETYEIAIPMGDETEMIAARTIEEIARRHSIPSKEINQIKTALVEACINATEHSLSPDRRIRQTITVYPDRMTITVANRGLRLIDKTPDVSTAENQRRGWGLELMKKLMDEVVVERTDDGTVVRMTKQRRSDTSAAGAS